MLHEKLVFMARDPDLKSMILLACLVHVLSAVQPNECLSCSVLHKTELVLQMPDGRGKILVTYWFVGT